MKKLPAILFAVSVMVMLTSCASSGGLSKKQKKIKDVEYLNSLNQGDFDSCLKYMESLYPENSKKKKNKNANLQNKIRDDFDIGMLNHYMGDYEKSLQVMNSTDSLMHQAFTKSITQGIAAATINDNMAEYGGTPYEYMYLNIFNALNYYNLGDYDEAAVEIRKLNNKQKEFIVKYGSLLKNLSDSYSAENSDERSKLENAYKTLNLNRNQFAGQTPKKPTEEDIFRDSPLARYISLLFYMMEGDDGNASLDARTLNVLNKSIDVSDDLKIPRGNGRLNVLAFSGFIGRRGEQRIRIGPFLGIYYHRKTRNGSEALVIPPFDLEFAYPVFPAPQSYESQVFTVPASLFDPLIKLKPGNVQIIPNAVDSVTSVQLVMDDDCGDFSGKTYNFSLLEDLNYAVQQDVNLKAKTAYTRSVIRSLIRKFTTVTGSSVALTSARIALDENNGDILQYLAYTAAYVALAASVDALDSLETADIRQAYVLPAKANACGITLPEGNYSFTVKYFAGQTLVHQQHFSNVSVKDGKPTIVESLCTK